MADPHPPESPSQAELLEELERLLEESSQLLPLKLRAGHEDLDHDHIDGPSEVDSELCRIDIDDALTETARSALGPLIVTAVNALPSLLASARRVRELEKELKQEAKDHDECHHAMAETEAERSELADRLASLEKEHAERGEIVAKLVGMNWAEFKETAAAKRIAELEEKLASLEKGLEAAVREERESCAKVADERAGLYDGEAATARGRPQWDYLYSCRDEARAIANAIRSRAASPAASRGEESGG